MEDIEFDFETKEYLFFLKFEEEVVYIGIIEIEKEQLIDISEEEKRIYVKNMAQINYEMLSKFEKKVNPKALVELIKYIEEATYLYYNTKQGKDIFLQVLKNMKYNPKVVWKISL